MEKILLSDIDIGEEEINKVIGVLNTKWISMGEITHQFEQKFAKYIGVKHAIAVSNGTAALHLATLASEIKPGDEVIVPSLTFVATSNSILYCGAKPIFADVQSGDNLTISPESIKEKISKKTKGIIVMHYGGYPCDMKSIMEIARDYNLFVIEDAAHAPGARLTNKMLGSIGDIGCFSFFSNKNLVTGEGGMVTTNNDEFAKKITRMRSHGMTTLSWDRYKGRAFTYDVTTLGYNYRTNDISSALGLCQLDKLNNNNKIRKYLTNLYKKYFLETEFIKIPFKEFEGLPSYHIFPILLDKKVNREKLMASLKKKGIQTSIHFPPIHLFSYYRKAFGFKEGLLPLTEYIGKQELTLPLHSLLKKSDIEHIVNQIHKFLKTI